MVALLFILFAFYGSGAEADQWRLVLFAIGVVVRAIMHKLSPPSSMGKSRDLIRAL